MKDDLLYDLNSRPPVIEIFFVSLQHLLGIFVPIITPGLIICGALGLDLSTTAYIVNMSLFASGISTFIQVYKIGPLGSGLLSIQGTSFAFVAPIITAGKIGGLSMIIGVSIIGSFIEMILSRFLAGAKKIITPLVSGIVVVMIGLTLIKTGMFNCAGGAAALKNNTFGSLTNLALSGGVFITIFILNASGNKYIRMSSIFLGLAAGYIVSIILGMVDISGFSKLDLFCVPVPFKYGFDFSLSAFFPVALIYLITTIETIGDLTATSIVSKEPITGDVYMKRLSGGVLADGFNSLLAAVFNSFPNTTFSQNNGIIQMTGVASRMAGYYIAAFLTLMGLFPVIGIVFSVMPAAVLGGGTLLMFATIAANGIKIISTENINRRAISIMAISFGLGLGVTFTPEILKALPEYLRDMFGSGITTGGLSAFIANILIPDETGE